MMNLFWCRSEKYGDSLFAYGREGAKKNEKENEFTEPAQFNGLK